jgi:hypothetical protein
MSKKTKRVSITKFNLLTLFREIIAIRFDNHTKYINTLCVQNIELFNVKRYVPPERW